MLTAASSAVTRWQPSNVQGRGPSSIIVRPTAMPSAHLLGRTAAAFIAASIMIASAACAPAVVSSGGASSFAQRQIAPVGRQSPSDRLARPDLSSMTELSLEEAVRRLRPEWMRVSPSARQSAEPGLASVYTNDSYVGGLEALRMIPVGAVEEMRYLTPTAARARFGMFCPCAGGVIVVTTHVED